MHEKVTVVVVPRDRFSSVAASARAIIDHSDVPYRLLFLDLGYSKKLLANLRQVCAPVLTEFASVGRTIPMLGFKEILARIQTPYVAWVDNDTYVTPQWLSTLIARANQGARVILPVTLEREGLDPDPQRNLLRNHISHAELRRVMVDGVSYLFDYKPFRRAAPEDLPPDIHTVDFFELHAFFAETAVLRQLDYPAMVVREHIDLGMQLHRLGIDIWCDPQVQVIFDNIHEAPTLDDLKFFFFRWDEKLVDQSHQLFEQRWGYRFYNEQFMKNWAYRRKVFSICRWARIPHRVSDLISRAMNKFFRHPIPDNLSGDPLARSERVLERREIEGRSAGSNVGGFSEAPSAWPKAQRQLML